jgi:hypothetical protein
MNTTHFDARCPDRTCARVMMLKPDCARCPRCGVIVLFPSLATAALMAAHVRARALTAVQDPDVHQGFRDWLANEAYWDGGGYRLKADRRRRAAWSKAVVSVYPDNADFHEAAHVFSSQGVA